MPRPSKPRSRRSTGPTTYNGSEIQVDYFDVNYYGIVRVEDEWDAKRTDPGDRPQGRSQGSGR